MAKGKKGVKGKKSKKQSFTGLSALLLFPLLEDRAKVLHLMRRFSAAVRYAYNRLLEGEERKTLKREGGPLCTLFGLNTRYADDAVGKAQAILDSARESGQDPRKVVFGGRKLFEQLKRRHLSGQPLRKLKAEWKEKRQGTLYSRGDGSKGGNLNLRLVPKDGALWLRVNLGDGTYAWGLVKTGHPQLQTLLQRVYAALPYNVGLTLKEGKIYAQITWEEELPKPIHTRAGGVLALDLNADPYHLALALVTSDGNLRRHLTLSLEAVDRAPNKGARELLLWEAAHRVVALAEEEGVAIATERLKHLPKGERGDGTGRRLRHKLHRFAYTSLLRKVHALARRKGMEVVEINPQYTSAIGMLKYAPQLSLSKDIAAAYVIGRRALGLEEELPKGYLRLLQDPSFQAQTQAFYEGLISGLRAELQAERNPYLKRRLRRELAQARASLTLVQSLQGSLGSPSGSTGGRNPEGRNPWRVLKAGLFLPFLGRKVPRDLSPLKPLLHLEDGGVWGGWKRSLGPPPGGGPTAVGYPKRASSRPKGVANGG